MAGIGFELKKLFNEKGMLAKMKAYGYTGVITTGPMLLGFLFLLGVNWVGSYYHLDQHSKELFISMVTYSLFASLLITSATSMVSTRYIADKLYSQQTDKVLPSLEGTCCILLPVGGVLYAIFLAFAGITATQAVLNFILFEELLVVWTEMNYMTAIKRYKGILIAYAIAAFASFMIAAICGAFIGISLEVLLVSICVGYGIMMCMSLFLLYEYFPTKAPEKMRKRKPIRLYRNGVKLTKQELKIERLKQDQGPFDFLKWFDEFRTLAIIGLFTNIGLFSHLVIAWFGKIGQHVQGLYYAAPEHDVPALFAFLTILVTTINFVASVEVNFYPKYRHFYDLFNGKGSIKDIEEAEKEMLTVMEREIGYTAKRQFYVTVVMISIGLIILNRLPLGFNALMGGYFRVLCVGYGIYAVGNILMLMLLYFTDYKSAAISSVAFAVVTIIGCVLSMQLDAKYYGFAFTIGSMVYFVICLKKLTKFTNRLSYNILSRQPLVLQDHIGVFTHLAGFMYDLTDRSDRKIYETINHRKHKKQKEEDALYNNIIDKKGDNQASKKKNEDEVNKQQVNKVESETSKK